jgi:hypothetical protein
MEWKSLADRREETALRATIGMTRMLAALLIAIATAGCGGNDDQMVLFVDAEFDPDTISDISQPIHEANPGVAQSFTVLEDGKFEEFWLVVTQGESLDSGTIRITVRPLNGAGEPDPDPGTSIIIPFDVDTATLPPTLVDEFTEFNLGGEPDRNVLMDETYAIVVDFVSRATSTDVNPIARVLGQIGDPYPDGTGSTGESGVGFTNNTDDYFFRTFLLRESL